MKGYIKMMYLNPEIDDYIEKGFIAKRFAKIPGTGSSYSFLVLKTCPEKIRKEFKAENKLFIEKGYLQHSLFLFEEEVVDKLIFSKQEIKIH